MNDLDTHDYEKAVPDVTSVARSLALPNEKATLATQIGSPSPSASTGPADADANRPSSSQGPQDSESPATGFAIIDQLLRDRSGLLDRIESGRDLAGLARTMILTIFAAAAVFGAGLGLYRGGVQIASAAVKLPLVILLTAALVTPALSALRHVVDGTTQIRRDLALVLSCLALGTLVLAALAPVVMLAVSWGAFYHTIIIFTVGCCIVGGGIGLSLFVRGTRAASKGSQALIVVTALLLVGLVGAQMSWTLRPWVVRPRTEEVPIVRSLEGSFIDAVIVTSTSARGVYSREEAPLPGEEVRP